MYKVHGPPSPTPLPLPSSSCPLSFNTTGSMYRSLDEHTAPTVAFSSSCCCCCCFIRLKHIQYFQFSQLSQHFIQVYPKLSWLSIYHYWLLTSNSTINVSLAIVKMQALNEPLHFQFAWFDMSLLICLSVCLSVCSTLSLCTFSSLACLFLRVIQPDKGRTQYQLEDQNIIARMALWGNKEQYGQG